MRVNPLPHDVLQSEVFPFISLDSKEPEEKCCHYPIVVHYNTDLQRETHWDCLLPCENEPSPQDPDVEIRPKSATEAVCSVENDFSWHLMCLSVCYTPALLTDLTYLAYSCCTFPIKKFQTWRQNRSDYETFFGPLNQLSNYRSNNSRAPVNQSMDDQDHKDYKNPGPN